MTDKYMTDKQVEVFRKVRGRGLARHGHPLARREQRLLRRGSQPVPDPAAGHRP
jgi:hypothetical protein